MSFSLDNDLPQSWESTTIGEVTLPYETAHPTKKLDTEFQYIDIGSIDNTTQTVTNLKTFLGKDAPSRARRVVKKGDVLFSTVRTYLKNIALVPAELDGVLTSTGIAVLRAASGISNKYLFYFVSSDHFVREISSAMDGTLYPAVTDSDVAAAQISIPPLNEQRRIVAKIEALKARSQRVKEALEAIRPLQEQFRQSVLAAAFRGDLTADWREKNPDVEPASVLLKRIRAERRRRWEGAELEKMKASGKTPKNDKWEKKYEEPPTPDLSLLPQLVDGWIYSFLEPLLSTKRTGLKTGPFGSLLKKHEHRADGIPVLGIENISSMGFVKGNKIYIDEAKAKDIVDYDAQEGDVLISRSGTVGEVCVVPSGIGEARISTNLIRICLAENALLPEYFCFLFRGSSFILNQISDLCSGSTRDFLNQTILSSLIFPIPPWEEQQEIVQRIRALFDFSNKIENQVSELAQSLEWLNQSILAKAFRGELVPQDPNDEPASILLERIQAERANREAEAKAAKKSTGKTNGRRSRKVEQQDSESVQLGLSGVE